MPKREIREYRIWKAMKSRCYSPCHSESNYQVKLIEVCDEWVDNFERFFSDMGRAPSDDHSLDRIDNDGDYCKSNCRWATHDTQSKNRGSFNNVFTHGGKSMVLKDWARELGIKYTTLHQRIFRSGLPFDDAIKEDPFKRVVSIGGESMTSTEWCKKIGIKPSIIVDRVRRGGNYKNEILKELTKFNERN
jgi:hypothetical protein